MSKKDDVFEQIIERAKKDGSYYATYPTKKEEHMKTVIEMAREAGLEEMWELTPRFTLRLERFAELVRAEERAEVERLRSLCDEMLSELYVYRASEYLKDVTAAIRARRST